MLTLGSVLDHQFVVVSLGITVLRLYLALVLVAKHLRAVTVAQELLVVGLQTLYDTAVLLWSHF